MMAAIFALWTATMTCAWRENERAAHGLFFVSLIASIAMYLHHADSTLKIDL